MTKSIRQRIDEIQSNKNSYEFLEKNLNTLQSSLEKLDSQSRQLTLQLFLLFFTFELLTRAAISEINLGYFKIGDLTLVIKILPIVISYTYYEAITIFFLRKLKITTITKYIQKELQPLSNTDLDAIIFSNSSYDAEYIIVNNVEGRMSKIVENLTFPLKLIIVLGPPIFALYAYYRIFAAYGVADNLSWLFLLVSLTFLIQGFSIFLQTAKFTE
jgi:hypothetical protein